MPAESNNVWLVLLLAVPLIGAFFGSFVPTSLSRSWALLVSLVTLVVAVILGAELTSAPDHVLLFAGSTVAGLGVRFSLFVDPISIWLVLLTAFLMPLSILFSFGSIREREREYYAWMLALLVVMLGVFIAKDLLLFYVFFELTLVPMFFIIGIWGGSDRRYAAGKFFLFTFAGGVFTLAAAVYLGLSTPGPSGALGNFDIPSVIHYAQTGMSTEARWWVVLGLLAGFAVKTPLFPVHTWLPLAHTEAPTAGSVILAGVLLKLGTYGLLRVAVPAGIISASGGTVFPELVQFTGVICVIGVIYAALVAWVQQDIKKLVAYSSVSHLGFCVLGMFSLNAIGMQGSVLYMINHGLSTGALFLVIGMIYDRYHTRDIDSLSGLARVMPVLAFFFVFFTLASIGLPGLNGFVSEFLTTLGAFTSGYLGIGFGVAAAFGIILGALYMLHMLAKVLFGPLKVPVVEGHGDVHGSAGHGPHGAVGKNDIGVREISILAPIALACVVFGVRPGLIIDPMLKPIEAIRAPAAEVNASRPKSPNVPPQIALGNVAVGKVAVEAAARIGR